MNFFNSNDLARLGTPIWERLFLTSMVYKDTLTTEHIRQFGMPTVGDDSIDADMHNHMVDRYLTINQMVDYYKEGISVYIKIHTETKDIYDIISSYLLCWVQYLQNGINIGGAPIDDLIALDRFASSVYDHAVEHITDDFIHSHLVNTMSKHKAGRSAFDKPEVLIHSDQPKQRESLATIFSERIFQARGKLWR
jgi:hypothetical protein